MSQETILQIMPATGWVAVYDVEGEESAEPIVCFALVESTEDGQTSRDVRPMVADGNTIDFADTAENFVRVDEADSFDEDEDEDDEDEG
ncbi:MULTISPECIES: hypothetical protein [Dyella]|uniref:Uncharacterized protein n=2 Tax=Dyella TaxID=231454 RepID=A0A4R0YYR3_9GAMM|nr:MULTISPECIES: hypothetical protein [Dyella]TBR40482.1 hypothetical protein EYV96_10105 [Dyella terrae]TCI11936.1 hypothetical protein EZM97_00765 [Dyella soli]